MTEPDDEERQLRMELMATQIEQARLNIDRLRQEIKTDNRKFAVQLLIGTAAILGVGVAIGRFWLFHT